MHPGSLLVADVKGLVMSGQVATLSGRTSNFAVMKIISLLR
jgi:hypothetical protein